jgi:tetratricopeptide (TPR) repeat protein
MGDTGGGPRKVCFMVMPFNVKPTLATGAPPEVDFDHLWTRVLQPTLQDLGFRPVRADQEWGPMIVKEMLERLVASDLVVADISIGNANVYYEIGIRHAAQNFGCVLISADWARPLFDIQQMRRITYPLSSKQVGDDEIAKIRAILTQAIPQAAYEASPLKSLLPSYPNVSQEDLEAFREDLKVLAELQTNAQIVRELPPEKRQQDLKNLVDGVLGQAQPSPSAVLEILYLLRDCERWDEVVAFVDKLPKPLDELEVIQEQRALAVSNAGQHERSVALLKKLIDRYGPTPERLGILGGRYKRLYRDQGQARYLDLAIDAYERGFRLNLNAYYCGSNLPRLLRERKAPGDEERARVVSFVVAEACEAARQANTADEWLNPVLLGLAFDNADVALATRCLDSVRREGHVAWKLETTLQDLQTTLAQIEDQGVRQQLTEIWQQLARLTQ